MAATLLSLPRSTLQTRNEVTHTAVTAYKWRSEFAETGKRLQDDFASSI